jgi:hypothetical protein
MRCHSTIHHTSAGRSASWAVTRMVAVAHIEPAVHVVIGQRSSPHHAAVAGYGRAPEAGSHVTKRPTRKRPCPYQRSTGATETGDNPPGSSTRQGEESYRSR